MKGTHEEFVKFNDGSTAFITGIKDKCDHNYSEVVFELANGELLYEKDYRCPTEEATWNYVSSIATQKKTSICGQTTACAHCGKIFTWKDIQEMEWEA